MKKLLLKTFNNLGYKIEKTKINKNITNSSQEKPVYIEFIGPSGVGKTTLFSEVIKKRKTSDNWTFVKELIPTIQSSNIKEYSDEVHLNILTKRINNITTQPFDYIDKIGLLKFYTNNIYEDIIITSENRNYTVIFEDGIFHNFEDELLDLHEDNLKDFKLLAENRAMVQCFTTKEQITKQINLRLQTTNAIRPVHKGKTKEALIEEQFKALKRNEEFTNKLMDLGIPVLKIDTSKNLQDNAKTVSGFINKLQANLH